MAHYIFQRNNGYNDFDFIVNFETMELTDYPEYAAQIDDNYLPYLDMPYLNSLGFFPVGITTYGLRINPLQMFIPRLRGFRPLRMPGAPRLRGAAPRPMPGRPIPPRPHIPHPPVAPRPAPVRPAPAPVRPAPAPAPVRPAPAPVPGRPAPAPARPAPAPAPVPGRPAPSINRPAPAQHNGPMSSPLGGPVKPGEKGPGRR